MPLYNSSWTEQQRYRAIAGHWWDCDVMDVGYFGNLRLTFLRVGSQPCRRTNTNTRALPKSRACCNCKSTTITKLYTDP